MDKVSNNKRIKRICLHPNPLFEKWLREWKTEAEKRGSNRKYNFQKAINSLRKYPLPLYSGKECSVLAHFGEKICKLIDQKLEEYIADNGPVNWKDLIKVKHLKKTTKTSNVNEIQNCQLLAQVKEQRRGLKKKDDSSNKRKTNKREYMPAYRSGAYALLIALENAICSSNPTGNLKKQELIKIAEEFCDSSFTNSTEGSYYTAWSSMSTLIKKNLVTRSGNPSRYSLTEEGRALALRIKSSQLSPQASSLSSSSNEERRLLERKADDEFSEDRFSSDPLVHDISSSDEEGEKADKSTVEEISLIDFDPEPEKETKVLKENKREEEILFVDDDDDGGHPANDKNEAPLNNSFTSDYLSMSPTNKTCKETVSFTYVTEKCLETPTKAKAEVFINEDKGTVSFLIKAKIIELFASNLDYELVEDRCAPPGYTYAFIPDSCAPTLSHGLSVRLDCLEPISNEETRLSSDFFLSPEREPENSPKMESFGATKTLDEVGKLQTKRKLEETRPVKKLVKKIEEKKKMEDELSTAARLPSTLACHEHLALKPGAFHVVLCVDNTEVLGGPSSGKQNGKATLKAELQRHGIDFSVRDLKVGDFLWTCQGRDSNGEEVELALPFVIERKRMDDLSQSIRDGRFKEQKFRLKQSGLSHPIYLVEEFGSAYTSLPIASCEQAVTNTQVIDKFAVKFTKDIKETAAYLTIMTRYLQGKFKNKTLHCVSRESPSLTNNDLSSPVQFLMSFKELNSSCAKSQPLTIQDMLAKHLLKISGASVDKVSSIIQKYKTPRLLIEALEESPSHLREKLLSSNIKCQKSGRALDQTISAHIARLYTWDTLT